MTVVPLGNYLLPSSFLHFGHLLLCKLGSYGCFHDSCIKPDLIAFLPSWNTLYPWGCRMPSTCSLGGWMPGVCIYCGDRRNPFYLGMLPINVQRRCFKERVSQNVVILTNVSNEECMSSIMARRYTHHFMKQCQQCGQGQET